MLCLGSTFFSKIQPNVAERWTRDHWENSNWNPGAIKICFMENPSNLNPQLNCSTLPFCKINVATTKLSTCFLLSIRQYQTMKKKLKKEPSFWGQRWRCWYNYFIKYCCTVACLIHIKQVTYGNSKLEHLNITNISICGKIHFAPLWLGSKIHNPLMVMFNQKMPCHWIFFTSFLILSLIHSLLKKIN